MSFILTPKGRREIISEESFNDHSEHDVDQYHKYKKDLGIKTHDLMHGHLSKKLEKAHDEFHKLIGQQINRKLKEYDLAGEVKRQHMNISNLKGLISVAKSKMNLSK